MTYSQMTLSKGEKYMCSFKISRTCKEILWNFSYLWNLFSRVETFLSIQSLLHWRKSQLFIGKIGKLNLESSRFNYNCDVDESYFIQAWSDNYYGWNSHKVHKIKSLHNFFCLFTCTFLEMIPNYFDVGKVTYHNMCSPLHELSKKQPCRFCGAKCFQYESPSFL